MDFSHIDRQGWTWPFEQVAEVIAGAIESGELAPGQRLPSQERLAQMAGVSKTVVRNAVKLLHEQGKIVTRPRPGTFVAGQEAG